MAGDLFSEALFCKLYLPGVNSEKADVVMARVLDMQDEFIRRANRPDGKENKKRVKEYYSSNPQLRAYMIQKRK